MNDERWMMNDEWWIFIVWSRFIVWWKVNDQDLLYDRDFLCDERMMNDKKLLYDGRFIVWWMNEKMIECMRQWLDEWVILIFGCARFLIANTNTDDYWCMMMDEW